MKIPNNILENRMKAPFTEEQVQALNAFQNSGLFHPFTCGNNRSDQAHKDYALKHGGDCGQLVATKDGLVCPVCDYKQDWAHDFMADSKNLDQLKGGAFI